MAFPLHCTLTESHRFPPSWLRNTVPAESIATSWLSTAAEETTLSPLGSCTRLAGSITDIPSPDCRESSAIDAGSAGEMPDATEVEAPETVTISDADAAAGGGRRCWSRS